MDRVLVTGGAGFIGSNFIRHLINETNSKVINLDKLTYAGNLRNIKDLRSNKAHRFVKGTSGTASLWTRLFRRPMQW